LAVIAIDPLGNASNVDDPAWHDLGRQRRTPP
jgi:hypothetical protein